MRLLLFLFVLALLGANCQPQVGAVTLCGAETFDTESRTCRNNEADTTITTHQAFCVLPLDRLKGQKVQARFFYLDDEILAAEQEVTSESGSLVFQFSQEGVSLLPGGAWRCEFDVGGEKRSAGFTSGAAAGPILDSAACPTSAVDRDSAVRLCLEDFGAQGFPDTNEVTCSATVAGAKGKLVRVALMRGGSLLGHSLGIEPDMQLTIYAKHFATSDDSAWGPGAYFCRFVVDGQTVEEKPFLLVAR